MALELPDALDDVAWREVLGYLNFSSGAPDRRFRSQLNRLFALAEAAGGAPYSVVGRWLEEAIGRYTGSSAAFADLSSAEAARRAVFQGVLPAYRDHHRDLLHHQRPEDLFNSLFVARAFETVLALGGGREAEPDADLTAAALAQLNDFLGHRPLPTLQSTERHEPYPHERVRPVPLYLHGAGVAAGRYRELIDAALTRLRSLPEALRETAHFDLDALDELAFDPRAYDFDHPVSKRPNYLFGQWDPHHVTNQGTYDRFVLQQATLDALLSRIEEAPPDERGDRLEEAGAVLAVTMLMAAMTSGRGPEAHDSTVTLATLVARIARLRDAAYEALVSSAPEPLQGRLLVEAQQLQQPYGGARQHLNQSLARLRAAQLQHVRLAELYARLGARDLAARHVDAVPAASARMAAEIRCRIAVADRLTSGGRLADALRELDAAEDCLLRAIDCGALADPWIILGFQGQFSLFRAVENSVPDHRLELLIDRVEQLFGGWRRLAAQAAASGDAELTEGVHARFERRAAWWDRFAATTVDQVRSLSGREAVESSRHVAASLAEWHRGGTATGDLAFWRQHVERFDSARAYAQVVEALLERGDLVAAQALLVQWLSEAHRVKLHEGEDSFHRLVAQWLRQAVDEPWSRWKRFVELLEANADSWWEAPELEIGRAEGRRAASPAADDSQAADDEHELYRAAYDQMTYRDSTADGVDADMLEGGAPTPSDFELDRESQRLGARVAMLSTAAEVWQAVAARAVRGDAASDLERQDRDASLAQWSESAQRQRAGLTRLLDAVHGFALPPPLPSHESHLEYDRRSRIKESLLERIVLARIAAGDALRRLRSAQTEVALAVDEPALERCAVGVLRGLDRCDAERARSAMPELLAALNQERILFVPLGKGGDPRQVVDAKSTQHLVRQLVRGLPRIGRLVETCQLLRTAQAMERNRPSGSRPVSEFDSLFREGLTGLVGALASAHGGAAPEADADLLEALRHWSRSLLKLWLRHSQSLRLSVLEGVRDERHWLAIRTFITAYGEGLFTQRFLNPGNLRAILEFGVERYLRRLEADPPEDAPQKLLHDLETTLKRSEAATCLELTMEAVVENHEEYVDYNSTTVQSDHGDKLYVLLDFLRLKAAYHRVAWNIRPLVWVHDELVRLGRNQAADLWRRSIVEQTSQVADWHLKRLAELRAEHAVSLTSVGDRLAERFVQPLALARLRALVAPAAAELRSGDEGTACRALDQEVDELIAVPSGVRMGEPEWLEVIEDEVERIASESRMPVSNPHAAGVLPLTPEEVEAQWQRWEQELAP